MKRLFAAFLASILGLTAFSGISYAQTQSNPIGAGLWEGADTLQLNTTPNSQNSSGGSPATPHISNQGTGIYAALGDSIASGAGLPASDREARCFRSTQAYAYKVAATQNLRLVHAACGGATAGDLVTRQGVSGPNIAPQLDTAFANGVPQLITITAGANDLGWGNFFRKCSAATCGTSTDNAAIDALRAAYKIKLEYVFTEIQRRSNNRPPTVVITGYSNPISNYCKNRQQYITNPEIDWLNSQRTLLNQAIREVAGRYNFVKYASTNFDGHSVCSTDPWMQGLNTSAPLHPNAAGQDAIANSINTVLGRR